MVWKPDCARREVHPGRFRYSCAVTSWHNHANTFKSTGAQWAEKSRDQTGGSNYCDFVISATLNRVELKKSCWKLLEPPLPPLPQDAPQTRRIEEAVCLSIAPLWTKIHHPSAHATGGWLLRSPKDKNAGLKYRQQQHPIMEYELTYSLVELTPDNWSNLDSSWFIIIVHLPMLRMFIWFICTSLVGLWQRSKTISNQAIKHRSHPLPRPSFRWVGPVNLRKNGIAASTKHVPKTTPWNGPTRTNNTSKQFFDIWLSPKNEWKHWLYAVILTLSFQDSGF